MRFGTGRVLVPRVDAWRFGSPAVRAVLVGMGERGPGMSRARRVHPWREFEVEHSYIRNCLRQAEALYRAGRFGELAEVYLDLSGLAGQLENYATDNYHGVADSTCRGYRAVSARDDDGTDTRPVRAPGWEGDDAL